MAGRYLFSSGVLNGFYDLFNRAVDKYLSWGATAVAKRVENEMQQLFGADYVMQEVSYEGTMVNFASSGHRKVISRKRDGSY